MHKHASGKPKAPARKPSPRPHPKPAAKQVAPTQKPPDELHTAVETLLDVLHRMPWCRDHRPDCPASSAGPCLCGSADLVAAMAHVGGLLHP